MPLAATTTFLRARRAARRFHVLRRERTRLRGPLDAAADAHLRVDDARRLDGARGVHGRPRGGQLSARRLGRPAPGPGAPGLWTSGDRDRRSSDSRCRCCSGRSRRSTSASRPRSRTPPMVFFVVQFLLVGLCSRCPARSWAARCRSSPAGSWAGRRDRRARRRALRRQYARRRPRDGIAATYVLLPHAGVSEGELVAVAINVARGAPRLSRLARGARAVRRAATRAGQPPPSAEPGAGLAARRAPAPRRTALSGFAAMVDEVAWARLFALVFGSSVYAFGLMLLLFLGGIAIGSACFRPDAPRRPRGASSGSR